MFEFIKLNRFYSTFLLSITILIILYSLYYYYFINKNYLNDTFDDYEFKLTDENHIVEKKINDGSRHYIEKNVCLDGKTVRLEIYNQRNNDILCNNIIINDKPIVLVDSNSIVSTVKSMEDPRIFNYKNDTYLIFNGLYNCRKYDFNSVSLNQKNSINTNANLYDLRIRGKHIL